MAEFHIRVGPAGLLFGFTQRKLGCVECERVERLGLCSLGYTWLQMLSINEINWWQTIIIHLWGYKISINYAINVRDQNIQENNQGLHHMSYSLLSVRNIVTLGVNLALHIKIHHCTPTNWTQATSSWKSLSHKLLFCCWFLFLSIQTTASGLFSVFLFFNFNTWQIFQIYFRIIQILMSIL